MNKFMQWMLAAILICGMTTTLTSCSKDDDNNAIVQPVKEYFTGLCKRRDESEFAQLHQGGRPHRHVRHGRHVRGRTLPLVLRV